MSVLLACALVASAGPALAARHPVKPARHAKPVKHVKHARPAEWRIAISSIGVHARLVTLGNPRGDVLPLPTLAQAQDAGWYPFTSAPGAAGNAVVAGHVDTYTGPRCSTSSTCCAAAT